MLKTRLIENETGMGESTGMRGSLAFRNGSNTPTSTQRPWENPTTPHVFDQQGWKAAWSSGSGNPPVPAHGDHTELLAVKGEPGDRGASRATSRATVFQVLPTKL